MIQFIQHQWPKELKKFHGKASIVFCDPPYNIGIKYDDDSNKDSLVESEYFDWCKQTIRSASRLLKDGGTFWWLCPATHLDQIGPILSSVVGPRLYCIIKQESFSQYQSKSLTEDYRLLFCHQKPGELIFNPEDIKIPSARQSLYNDKRAVSSGRVPGQIWNIRRLQGTSTDRVDWHPAQLPPELLKRIVLGWSNPEDLVIDGFFGSGNMGLVCKRHDREFVGIDQSLKYVTKASDRINTLSGFFE